MNIYDLAHDLARALKSSEEFKKYNELNKKVMANPKHKDMIEDFRKEVMNFQLASYGKDKPGEESVKKVQALQGILMANSEIAEYLTAELRFSQMFEDISKIIAEAVKTEE